MSHLNLPPERILKNIVPLNAEANILSEEAAPKAGKTRQQWAVVPTDQTDLKSIQKETTKQNAIKAVDELGMGCGLLFFSHSWRFDISYIKLWWVVDVDYKILCIQ